ncbi:hypothetical protein P153DRAFT_343774 [Dothidotthia symphoricarpi CBS 119687]|uniref:Uncharacterized protein n=1 Tax=Dothidotthia symphoricarpi CBS 119687 TaxID=1392245 RepID=A0A6A6A6Z6_9PLEO|nr:uncharacterized protein P153DRAFT_343774 [Dothidotthia symphoricarpi CBS 119687]KAF2127590.1 hypothetical protein P153DRAFT_343774 [Dothidotthia symphoricarpi CBS 119687]
MARGPVCGVENCRSRRYDEGEDGFQYCENGHRQGVLLRTEEDDDDFATGRRTVTHINKDEEEQKKIARHFSGRQALDLHLKCLQLILRHQIWFLVKEKGLPAELETVIFDLWSLRIAQFGDKIARQDQESESQSQVYNTLETDDSDTDGEKGTLRTPKGRDKKLGSVPNLIDCLALCYLGMITLRLPVTPGDIYVWITDGKMAYRRAIKLLPLAMRDRLPPSYHSVLDPSTLLKHKRLYATITDLQISFEKDYAISWPALNVQLLLFRYLKELALPLELYDATIRLSDLLGYSFVLRQDGNKRLGIRHLPEAQLAGCLVVCVKLLYPLDGEERYPKSSSEPTATVLDWDAWCRQMETVKAKQRGGDTRFTTEEMTKLEEKDVFSMLGDQVDQYLGFYADTFLDDAEIQRTRENDDFRNALYEMFPTDGKSHGSSTTAVEEVSIQERLDVVKAVHSSMRSRAAVGDDDDAQEDVLRPGEAYRLYKKEHDLPGQAKIFYEEVARMVGLSMDMLIMAVLFTEARIEQWRRRVARKAVDNPTDE